MFATTALAKTFTLDITQDFSEAKYRVSFDAPTNAVASPATRFKESEVKWNNTTLRLTITDSAPTLNMPQGKQIRSSKTAIRSLQVFQLPQANSFSFSVALQSKTFKAVYVTCANTFSLSSLAEVNEAIKVCDSIKVIKQL
jgi:hypothetical protein